MSCNDFLLTHSLKDRGDGFKDKVEEFVIIFMVLMTLTGRDRYEFMYLLIR